MKSSVVNTIIVHYLCRKLVQELSYDAWGRLRDPETRELYGLEDEPTPMFGRGFTGHEHIVGFRLVNMNARLYDPMTGRMLSPDPIVQSPYFSQNHNRHSYCLNNPLAFTDPTGMKIVYDMTDEEKAELDSFLDLFDKDSPFMQLLEIIDKAEEIITVEFGNTTTTNQGNQVVGQYNTLTKTVTFLKGVFLQPSFVVEEFYHAYQDIYKSLMNGMIWNREFEVKLVTDLIVSLSFNTVYANLDFGATTYLKIMGGNYLYLYSDEFEFLYKYYGNSFVYFYRNVVDYNIQITNVPLTFYKFINEIKW